MRFVMIFLMIAFFHPVLAFSQGEAVKTSEAVVVQARIDGLVCDFCARALQKVFLKDPRVQTIKVNLTEKTLILELKPGEEMDDQTLKDLVKKAGYVVEEIFRKTEGA